MPGRMSGAGGGAKTMNPPDKICRVKAGLTVANKQLEGVSVLIKRRITRSFKFIQVIVNEWANVQA